MEFHAGTATIAKRGLIQLQTHNAKEKAPGIHDTGSTSL